MRQQSSDSTPGPRSAVCYLETRALLFVFPHNMACGELPREPEENECVFCASWTPERIKAAKACPMPVVDTSGRLTFPCYPHSAAPKPIVGGIGSPGPSKFLYIPM